MGALAQAGIRLPHQSGQQMRHGRPVARGELRPGDLVFWNGHVALSLGGNRIVHAANRRTGVAVGTIYGSPVGYRRLIG
jgi:cell wall-associated NlpC family hydrolase